MKGLLFKRDVAFPVYYKGIKTNKEIIVDILVENQAIVEIRSEREISLLQLHSLQSKLKISGKRMGIIITFNAPGVVEGYRKVMNNL